MDGDVNIIPSFLIQSFGYQWAWTFHINSSNTSYSIVDHYMVGSASINKVNNNIKPLYLFDISVYLILPIWTSIKIYTTSIDVIHSLGLYTFGIKIDAIPGRINLTNTLRSFNIGEYRGFCFELCGQGHSIMLLAGIQLTLIYLFFLFKTASHLA